MAVGEFLRSSIQGALVLARSLVPFSNRVARFAMVISVFMYKLPEFCFHRVSIPPLYAQFCALSIGN
jgi:hypothetical protein